jgi:hypothetical protein
VAAAGTISLPARKSAESHIASRPAITATAWGPHDGMSFEEWVAHGRRLGVMGRGVGWWIGDWLRFGNAAYGERYAAASRMTGYDRQSLMNMVYVASRVEPSRRREKLSFSHHAEIAVFDPAEQDEWLERAERDQLSVRDLREAIKTQRRGDKAARGDEAEVEQSQAAPEPVCPSCGRLLGSE